ncbi:MAG: hypothetical protein SP1CHLAM54_07980 [Chlamydiia bacterium]|nr:hypothetical protein [Chlamydiia bacterium]MCH9615704.1 hypothetical protein [Chlamydiia bacterium]MCH9628893.1 hypothetical protein [Chlamydiia bacterium]
MLEVVDLFKGIPSEGCLETLHLANDKIEGYDDIVDLVEDCYDLTEHPEIAAAFSTFKTNIGHLRTLFGRVVAICAKPVFPQRSGSSCRDEDITVVDEPLMKPKSEADRKMIRICYNAFNRLVTKMDASIISMKKMAFG